ncbi:hypothetical protein AN6575.2 [Aspergillus nidulans FGSC A4]|uniref:Myb-like transcription factor (Eurofung) n=1 Tax=Emericella nidulans (strain FGSC A4 / ATCC 38163 / CBS 112.46 / NRRL 194 / M139) TaxID=227321 RepID=Q5AYQ5_EMENI|nr:transcription factor TFIIIB subunit BDP1 [Aspergillus nidulans FGSC A4]EAA57915.1 hypothetical protein AN6575.2 [Aspergillus nidulans FGSC A4]CBF71015.1 TPA: putative Myb-like transcription factor (Eurofung) [Aspergillus nidulans FGSC A4]|eukprot:XP_664179.1 hypothetical protein AN6575.2 [Aspergillus nidulans FGSC A4]
MKSFSSSVINKSGKKFAPKAPARRAPPAPPRAPSRRPSVASQGSALHAPVTTSVTATPEPPLPATSIEPSAQSETTIAGSGGVPTVAPTVEHAPKEQTATAIPIPAPKHKASVPVPIPAPRSTTNISPAPSASTTTTVEPVAQAPSRPDENREVTRPGPDNVQNEQRHAPSDVAADSDNEVVPEGRPSKRLRTSIESVLTTTSPQPEEELAQLATPPSTQIPALEERTESRDESEVPGLARRSESAPKKKGRRASRSTSNDAGKIKKERKRRTRNREPTPDGAELIEIAPAVVKMSDLCKDTRTGKRSKRETELRAHELAEAERKKSQQEGGQKDETAAKQTLNESVLKEDQTGSTPNKSSQAGPVMRIVNGEIVLDTASLQVDRHADAERNGDDLEDVVENSLTRKVNQATYGKRSKTESWDEDMTELFYRGLRMFGTDFMVISKMFPGRSRRQIKLKFNNEERRDPQRIRETLLGPRESIDINTYSEMTNTVYDDPRLIQQELDEEKKRIEEQYEKDKKAQEDLLRNPDGVAGNNALGVDKVAIKGKRNNKKQSARDFGGGTEEILGSIDD